MIYSGRRIRVTVLYHTHYYVCTVARSTERDISEAGISELQKKYYKSPMNAKWEGQVKMGDERKYHSSYGQSNLDI